MTSSVRRVLLSWSSGKDSAWALHVLRGDPRVEVVALLTTLDETLGRVAMHAVRRELLRAQAASCGLELWEVPIPAPCTNEVYAERMGAAMERAKAAGVAAVAFGDLYLEDVRAYREKMLAPTGIEALFPLWGRDTRELALEMVRGGCRAVLTSVDPSQCPPELVGREFDEALLADLPPGADPCGENGEFHTFVYAGPALSVPLAVTVGEKTERDGFHYADVLAAGR